MSKLTDETSNPQPDIIYTKVDEAPALASGSLLPIIRAFTKAANVSVGIMDISLAGRILANFPDYLTEDQKQPNDLAALAEFVQRPEANIIKLPNISASVPQLNGAIAELQSQGYNVPPYPENPQNEEEAEVKTTYSKVLGSAVNPVLREGNSDRRAPSAVKEYAKKNPHSMGTWVPESKTHVATMSSDDFCANERSTVISQNSVGMAKIQFIGAGGAITVLNEDVSFQEGDVVDGTMMSKKALHAFLEAQINDARAERVLFSVHLKATMMKVSDPMIFGHVVYVFFKEVFDKHGNIFSSLGVHANNGLGEMLAKLQSLPSEQKNVIEADIQSCIKAQPDLYMVDSLKGITNLHVPSDVIIDASMPALIRGGGKGWGPDGKESDIKCVIPDSSYAAVYDQTINFCKRHGAFNPSQLGSVSNVGLMAQKAEEYGSHPHTFEAHGKGLIQVVDVAGEVLLEHDVEEGDIWRMCITRDAAVRDWVKLAVSRARSTGIPAVFWLNKNRSHDKNIMEKVEQYMEVHEIDGLNIQIMSPKEATQFSLERMRKGEDTISITGNVLRDYLTDLFPILEVGTSAKMLSIVPLMNGGSMFETGAGGSAPKHVQQMMEEGHLRWDSLGEFCALAASLCHLGERTGNEKAAILANTLDQAIGKLLDTNKSPSRNVGEIDNRGSHFYLSMYWAEALAAQDENDELKKYFAPMAEKLISNEDIIISELGSAQGHAVNLGGYYHVPENKVPATMRPSLTLNAIIG